VRGCRGRLIRGRGRGRSRGRRASRLDDTCIAKSRVVRFENTRAMGCAESTIALRSIQKRKGWPFETGKRHLAAGSREEVKGQNLARALRDVRHASARRLETMFPE